MIAVAAALLAGRVAAGPVETVSITGSAVSFRLTAIPGDTKTIRPFQIGTCEVTWEEYALYADSGRDEKVDGVTRPTQPDVENPRNPFPDGTVQTGRFPARSIGWYGACGYCAWLSRRTGRRFRLPTEREWERAAAADADPRQAWHAGNSHERAHAVGTRRPNRRGLYDLLGNVWEHCLEPFTPAGEGNAVRGGGWETPAEELSVRGRVRLPLERWMADDPKRPLRAWWLTDAPFVGLRIVAPEPDGASPADRAAAMGRISARQVHVAVPGSDPLYVARISGEIVYASGAPLDEVELEVCFADATGAAIRVDPRAKPAFGLAFPVLASTAHADGREQPLRPGESRPFSVEVPEPFDEVGAIPHADPIVKVTWVRFAR